VVHKNTQDKGLTKVSWKGNEEGREILQREDRALFHVDTGFKWRKGRASTHGV
jgi:hypothetical protein